MGCICREKRDAGTSSTATSGRLTAFLKMCCVLDAVLTVTYAAIYLQYGGQPFQSALLRIHRHDRETAQPERHEQPQRSFMGTEARARTDIRMDGATANPSSLRASAMRNDPWQDRSPDRHDGPSSSLTASSHGILSSASLPAPASPLSNERVRAVHKDMVLQYGMPYDEYRQLHPSETALEADTGETEGHSPVPEYRWYNAVVTQEPSQHVTGTYALVHLLLVEPLDGDALRRTQRSSWRPQSHTARYHGVDDPRWRKSLDYPEARPEAQANIRKPVHV